MFFGPANERTPHFFPPAIMTQARSVQLDASHFDSKARQWDDNPVFRERGLKIADAVRRAVPLNPGMRALDYGCGTGLLSFPLRDELGPILMADSSAGMLEVVNEKIAALGVTNMTTAQLDLLADPRPAQRFDLIVTAMTLHHVPDTDRILRVFHDLLNPGGYLCIADLDQEDGSFHGIEVDVQPHVDIDERPVSSSDALNWAHTSVKISSRVHRLAGLP